MKALSALSLTLLLGTSPLLLAIPQGFFGNGFFGPVIPATPRFGADLTGNFLDIAAWESGDLEGPWEEIKGTDSRRMTANPILFGAVPDSVQAQFDAGQLKRLEITYLNAGTFFAFKMGGEKSHQDRVAGRERRSEFDTLFRKHVANLKVRLGKGCGNPTPITVGTSDLLQARYDDYLWDGFRLRLAAREDHSVALLISRGPAPKDYLAPELAQLDGEERSALLQKNLQRNTSGDLSLQGIPVAHQGNTPFCGIHSLAMTAQYLGLNISTNELAAAAQFKNTGSARGSRVLDLYKATAEEAGMKTKVSSRFDERRLTKALESGLPVIVWRRVTKERERAHQAFAQKLATQPNLSVPSSNPRTWPSRKSKRLPSHGSVITGYNAERREVIFAEPWGATNRDRRMSADEMEASAYAAFYFQFER